ncbi:DUF3800 domain-containing protein [Streptomyces sp. ISL-96]|uniref:DUF3800 domain-containing protein n=1 Tax=Streptomyces sp. ISL-96 TaxID=2819191 RepID=UPI001BE7A778|nr:DUF3800 domain-containing protein [Streptomyces sp. ISL-96]MBT2488668.1 DUF3800 domain-containing protein [Streptomyces sp. ISL-96]
MYLCYVDEAGNGQVVKPEKPDSQPVMVIGGFTVPEHRLKSLVWNFIALKKKYEPSLAKDGVHPIDVIRHELKGDTIRRKMRHGGRNQLRTAHRILADLLSLLEQHDCKVLARIWALKENVVNDTETMYLSSVRSMCENFEHFLAERDGSGVVVLDSRSYVKNLKNVDCVTTEKFRNGADRLPHLAESPVFGHSDTHVGLQIADLVVSAILFPAACTTYADDLTWNIHCHPGHGAAREHCPRLGELQHRYEVRPEKWTGGVVVADHRRQLPGSKLFDYAGPTQPSTPVRIPAPAAALDLAPAAAFPEPLASEGEQQPVI